MASTDSSCLHVKQLNNNIALPAYAHPGDAGLDLSASVTIDIAPGEVAFVPLGIAVAIPENNVGLLFPRSGMASKRRITLANKVGVIDSKYRGEVIAALINEDTDTAHIEAGERVVQLVVMPFTPCEIKIVDSLDETERGEGGFGSTGYTTISSKTTLSNKTRATIQHTMQEIQLTSRLEALKYRKEYKMKLREKDLRSIATIAAFIYDADAAIKTDAFSEIKTAAKNKIVQATVDKGFESLDLLERRSNNILNMLTNN